jgi:hypothetical protein
MKASSTAISESLLFLKTLITFSHVIRYVPSIPVTSIALINIRVNLNVFLYFQIILNKINKQNK